MYTIHNIMNLHKAKHSSVIMTSIHFAFIIITINLLDKISKVNVNIHLCK